MREYHLKQLMWQGIPPPPAGERFHPRAHATWSSALTLIDKDFGAYGIGPSDFILQSVKGQLERAVTEYIKANFNLGFSE